MAQFLTEKEAGTFSKLIRPEWLQLERGRHQLAERQRAGAELLCTEIDDVIEDTDKATKKIQRDVDRKLDQRVKEMEFWERETADQLVKMKRQIDRLLAYEGILGKALESLLEPIHVNKKCLSVRKMRQGSELVHDDAEREMLKEAEVLEGVRALLLRTKEQVVEQTRLARKLKYSVEKNLKERGEALEIDRHNVQLKHHSFAVHPTPNYQPSKSIPLEEWHATSQDNINKTEQMLSTCLSLQGIVEDALKQTHEDLVQQKEKVDQALEDRIRETKDSKTKMEDQLSLVKKQIAETEAYSGKVLRAIESKQEPLKLAQKRLQNRALRPEVEKCGDAVQYGLEGETAVIGQSVEKLRLTLSKTAQVLKGLRHEQLELEKKIEIKRHTLLIDENECGVIRKSFSIERF